MGSSFPPRLLLVAKDFSDEVKILARHLKERFVSIELWRANLSVQNGSVILTTEEIDPPQAPPENVWRALGRLMKCDEFRNSFDVLGFADHYSKDCFAVSMRSAPAIRVHLIVPKGKTGVHASVWLPEKYRHPVTFEEPSASERKKLNERLGALGAPVPQDPVAAHDLATRLAREMEELFG